MNVLGASYRFDNELQLTAEHLFNGVGDSDNLDASDVRLKNGVSTSLNSHLSALSLSYEFTPLLIGRYDTKNMNSNLKSVQQESRSTQCKCLKIESISIKAPETSTFGQLLNILKLGK